MVLEHVKETFHEREKLLIDLIQSYDIEFEEIGKFGSYARGDYNVLSDIDICIIASEKQNLKISGNLRLEANPLRKRHLLQPSHTFP